MEALTETEPHCGTVSGPVAPAWMRISVRCELCGEPIEVLCDFRPTPVECPGCNLAFTYDPWAAPLAAPGVRLASLRRKEPPPWKKPGRMRFRTLVSAGVLTLLLGGLAAAGALAGMLR
jgi:hypothetical protein